MPIIQGDYKYSFTTTASFSKTLTPQSYPYNVILDVNNSQDFVYNIINIAYTPFGADERNLQVNVADGTSAIHTTIDQYISMSYNENNNTLTLNRRSSTLPDGQTFYLRYSAVIEGDVAGVETIDKTRTTYSDLSDTVSVKGRDYLIKSMASCFANCTSLIQAPVIPNNVASMASCFANCTSLTGDIYVYCGTLATRSNCFYNTTKSITLHAMNNNIEVCDLLAATANNDNVLVNVHSETPISFTDTQMNYMTDEGLKPLSLQTDASLVQCEVPDLVNGGTIVTNVNDALIDLYNRAEFPVNTWYISDGERVYLDGLMIQRNGNEVYCGGFGQGDNYYALCAFSVVRGGRYRIVGAPNYTITYRINEGNYTDIPSYTYDYSTIVSLNKGNTCTIYLKIEPRNYNLFYIPVLERVGGGA